MGVLERYFFIYGRDTPVASSAVEGIRRRQEARTKDSSGSSLVDPSVTPHVRFNAKPYPIERTTVQKYVFLPQHLPRFRVED